MKRWLAAGAAVVLLGGAAPIAIGAQELAERFAHWRAGVQAEGEILAAQRRPLHEALSPFSRGVYEVEYEFRTPSGAVRSHGIFRSGSGDAPARGDKLRLSYLPDDPDSSMVEDGFTALDAALLVGAGLLIWIGGAVFLWPELGARRG